MVDRGSLPGIAGRPSPHTGYRSLSAKILEHCAHAVSLGRPTHSARTISHRKPNLSLVDLQPPLARCGRHMTALALSQVRAEQLGCIGGLLGSGADVGSPVGHSEDQSLVPQQRDR